MEHPQINNKMRQIEDTIRQSVSLKQQIAQTPRLIASIQQAIDAVTSSFRHGKRVYFCGNGGSAADAQHLAAELSGRFCIDRASLPAEALHCNTSYITAVANDYSFDRIYSRLIEGFAQEGDILAGLSTSGNSANILNAFKAARQKNVTTIAFTGDTGGLLKEHSDILINVPSSDTPRIQEAHILIGHIICEQVEANIFG